MKEDIKFMIDHPLVTVLLMGTITGILPSLACGILFKILGL